MEEVLKKVLVVEFIINLKPQIYQHLKQLYGFYVATYQEETLEILIILKKIKMKHQETFKVE